MRLVCKHDHPLTPENVYTRPDGKAVCRECGKAARRKYKDDIRAIDAKKAA